MSCLIAFLTRAFTIAMGINPGAPGWNILEWFQNNIRNIEIFCSITVIKHFYGTVLEKFLMLALENFWKKL